MEMPQEGVHMSPRDLGEPVVDTAEESEENPGRHDVVEVADHVVGIVQVQIHEIEGQRQAGKTTNPEHGQEGHRPEHGNVETDGTAPQRYNHRGQEDDRWHRDEHCGSLEPGGNHRPHAGEIHMVGPHDETQETEDHDGPDHGPVAPERLARVDRNDLSHTGDRGQEQDVDLRVSQEPEEVLIKERTASPGSLDYSGTRGVKTAGHVEAGSHRTIH